MIETVKKYNKSAILRWHENVDKWHNANDNNIIPQIMLYGFRLESGELRKTGYVSSFTNGAKLFKTKRDAVSYEKRGY